MAVSRSGDAGFMGANSEDIFCTVTVMAKHLKPFRKSSAFEPRIRFAATRPPITVSRQVFSMSRAVFVNVVNTKKNKLGDAATGTSPTIMGQNLCAQGSPPKGMSPLIAYPVTCDALRHFSRGIGAPRIKRIKRLNLVAFCASAQTRLRRWLIAATPRTKFIPATSGSLQFGRAVQTICSLLSMAEFIEWLKHLTAKTPIRSGFTNRGVPLDGDSLPSPLPFAPLDVANTAIIPRLPVPLVQKKSRGYGLECAARCAPFGARSLRLRSRSRWHVSHTYYHLDWQSEDNISTY